MSWTTPQDGFYKINYDAALKDNRICAGAECRNWRGELIFIRVSNASGASPIKGEARATRLACVIAKELGVHGVIIEGDAQFLVKASSTLKFLLVVICLQNEN